LDTCSARRATDENVLSRVALRGQQRHLGLLVSLKVRLIAVLCAFVIVALVTTDAITYASFRSYAVGQLDQQLFRSANLVARNLGFSNPLGGPGSEFENQAVTPGTLATELSPSGQRLLPWTSFSATAQSSPLLPASLASLAADASGGAPVYRTVPGTGNIDSYRVLEASLTNGNVLVEAIPLTGTDGALHRLLELELLVSGAVLIALAAAAWLVIRLSLRPLQKMADTAGEIAAGDLSQRVGETDNRTEVGRLGRALNVMLGRIETAFREREASEARLRRFVADASHELRTPLTSIRGYAELFQHGLADRPADLDTAMRRIDSESTRMAGLVDDLLLLARLDQGRPLEREPVDLTTLVADAAQDARAIDPSRTVTREAPPSCLIIGDEGRLRQLLGNLVSNALAYTPDGSPLEIIAVLEPSQGLAPSRAKIFVVDHGTGITPEVAAHVFERFWRSDPARVRAHGGAGLGLSIVAAVADAHGGRVSIMETPGGGATFVVELPTEPGPGPSPWGANTAASEELTGNGAAAADAESLAGSTTSTEAAQHRPF
jgi:two-component system OmpR family sensor kinase